MEGGKFYATILSVSEYSRTDTLWVYVSIVVSKDLIGFLQSTAYTPAESSAIFTEL